MTASLRIRDVVERTGVGEATLRAWETRYGFPAPKRRKSGHRRYDERDVEMVREAIRLRDTGLPVPVAIERARRSAATPPASILAGLRRERPELPVHRLPKRSLTAISRAIEDESAYGAADLLLFGAFQHERNHRASEARWTVRLAARIAIAPAADQQLVADVAERLTEPVPASPEDLRRAESLTARIIAYLGDAGV